MNDKLCLSQKHKVLRLGIFDPASRKAIFYNSGPKAHSDKGVIFQVKSAGFDIHVSNFL